MPRRSLRGFTVVELAITLLVAVIIASFVQPSYNRALERGRRNAARARLVRVWESERLYWTQHGRFASSLADLGALGLLDTGALPSGDGGPFQYVIASSGPSSFEARAVRVGSQLWEGYLAVDQSGELTDSILPPL